MLNYKKEPGFSVVELMIAIAIIGILSAMAVPSFQKWSRSYNLSGAATDLYSHMQMAKVGAVKENRTWNIKFRPVGFLGYEVHNNAGKLVKTVDFLARYNGDILFADPTESKKYDTPLNDSRLNFNPNGLSDQGYYYISNKSRSKYYRVGMPSIAGSIRIEQWNGATWK